MTISSSALGVGARMPLGVIGALVDVNYLDALDTLINSDPQAVQVYTVVVDAATDSTAYSFSVDGNTISFTSGVGTTKALIAAGLLADFNATAAARGRYSGATDGVDTLTFTAVNADIDLVISDSDARLTTTETVAPAAANTIGFGLGILNLQSSDGEGADTCALVYAAKLTAQVDTLTVDYAVGESYTVTIAIDGETYQIGPVAATVDDATTSAAIATAINAMMPANTVIATNPAATSVVLTAEVAGKAFKTTPGLVSGTTARLSLAHTTSGPLTDINLCFAGISVYSTDTEALVVEGDVAAYAANSGVKVMRKGRIYVSNSEDPTTSDKVYVQTSTSGGLQGTFTKTASSTTLLLTNARWRTVPSRAGTVDLAVIELF